MARILCISPQCVLRKPLVQIIAQCVRLPAFPRIRQGERDAVKHIVASPDRHSQTVAATRPQVSPAQIENLDHFLPADAAVLAESQPTLFESCTDLLESFRADAVL